MYNLPVGPSCRGPWSPLTRGSSGGPWHQTSTYWCIHAWAPPGNAVERHVPIGLLSVSILVRLSLRLMGVICSRSGQSSLISYAKSVGFSEILTSQFPSERNSSTLERYWRRSLKALSRANHFRHIWMPPRSGMVGKGCWSRSTLSASKGPATGTDPWGVCLEILTSIINWFSFHRNISMIE